MLFERLEELGRLAVAVFDQPDAGPWELRNKPAVHTFSAVICWAGCDRLARIASRLALPEHAVQWRREADRLHAVISRRAWNPDLDSFVATFEGDHLDASLLLLGELDFLTADDPRFAATVDAIGRHLMRGDLLLRYGVEDDFGRPETAFTICTFWYIDALALLGRRDEARRLFESLLQRRNALGLLSEDIHPETGELWGNYPQTLFPGGADQLRHAPVAHLGRGALSPEFCNSAVTQRNTLGLDTLESTDILTLNPTQLPFRRTKMLGVIAAIALVIGGVSTGVVVSEENSLSQSQASVVSVQTVKTQDPVFGS